MAKPYYIEGMILKGTKRQSSITHARKRDKKFLKSQAKEKRELKENLRRLK